MTTEARQQQRPAPIEFTDMYLGGKWVRPVSDETYDKYGPMDPDLLLARVALAKGRDVSLAVDAALDGFGAWAATAPARRGSVLEAAAAALDARAEQVAHDMTVEMGKPIRESLAEVARSAQILRYASSHALAPIGEQYVQAAGGSVSTHRRPLGVVALITPWNFPCAIPIWKLAPALMCGNAVILKAALETPLSTRHIAECFAEAGLPAGVLSVLPGRGASAGATLVRDPRVSAVSFTGSVVTGRSVRDEATRLGIRVQLELGGHSPMIVTADADLDRAAEAAYAGAFSSAGQRCTATRRIYIKRAVYADFRAAFLARIQRGKIGDPLDPEVEIGPIVNAAQLEHVTEAVQRGIDQGGSVLTGGERLDNTAYLFAPTVFEGVADDSFLSQEEVFGPVTSLYEYDDFNDAITRANSTEFGLSSAIFTSDLGAALRFQRESQAGMIHVNSQTASSDIHAPFGGIKASGFGPHEQGRAALDFYSDLVTVYVDA
jgi:acyl-CoA reductase-like NAD-dependent aldehyde dehydrogenase